MPHLIRNSRGAGESGRGPCVLTVFDNAAHRTVVQETCAAEAADARVIDVSTPTDAVLALLSNHVDLVLVDVDLSGDLLPALALHVRRSSPHATFLGFGRSPSSRKVLPWRQLDQAVVRWLRALKRTGSR